MAEVVGSSCYALAEPDEARGVPDELDPATLLAWSDRLSGLGACQAVIGLILKLEALSRVRMSGPDRALLLHLLEGPMHWVFERRPRLTTGAIQAILGKGWDLTMDQRLACVGYRNLRQVLRNLDEALTSPDEDLTETRLWALEQQFLLLERQIGYAIRARVPPPPGTWLELHGRYLYFLDWLRGSRGAEPGVGLGGEPDLEAAYKRLLLLGIANGSVRGGGDDEAYEARLRGWVAETGLEPPGAASLRPGVWVLDPALDGPPVAADTLADLGPYCSVLVPPPRFVSPVQAPVAGKAASSHPVSR
jgi:hypothetical protein